MNKNLKFLSYAGGVAVLLLLVCAGCGSKQAPGDVMAVVDGHNIYRADVEKYYQNQIAGSGGETSDEQAASTRLTILRQLIDNEVFMRQAEKLGLLATEDEVDRRVNEIKAPFSKEEFEARLRDKKITFDDFRRDVRRSLTVDKVLNKEITSKISISDKDITDYYNAHKAEFNFIEPQYHLAHIWVTPMPNPQVHNLRNDKAQNESEARKKIQMISNRLESGEDFATIAMNFSEDTDTSGNGGDLGFTPESSLRNTDAGTREVISKLKPGQYSPIIPVISPVNKQAIGFEIVKLLAKEPAGQRELSDPRVQLAIRDQLRDRREQILRAAYDDVLHSHAKIENYYAESMLQTNGVKP